MTWTGSNPDIVSALVAWVAAPFAHKSRAVAWVANVIGFVLLLNVMRVAMMSSPLPFSWHVQPPLLLGMHLPYAALRAHRSGLRERRARRSHRPYTRALRGQG